MRYKKYVEVKQKEGVKKINKQTKKKKLEDFLRCAIELNFKQRMRFEK